MEGPPFHPSLFQDSSDDQPRATVNETNRAQCVGFGFSSVNAVAWARDRSTRYRELLRDKYPRSNLPPHVCGDFIAHTRSPVAPPVPSASSALQTRCVDPAPNPTASGFQTPDEYGSATSAVKPLMTPEELIKVRFDCCVALLKIGSIKSPGSRCFVTCPPPTLLSMSHFAHHGLLNVTFCFAPVYGPYSLC